jgi:predicted acetyltransferase
MIVIEVIDSFMPDAGGRFKLDASAGGATCSLTTKAPDISLSASDLGAAYLGGARLTALSRAGRVDEHTGGTIRLFDSIFATEQQPWCPHEF